MNARPLHDRLIVQRIDDAAPRAGAIIIPDSAKEKPQLAITETAAITTAVNPTVSASR